MPFKTCSIMTLYMTSQKHHCYQNVAVKNHLSDGHQCKPIYISVSHLYKKYCLGFHYNLYLLIELLISVFISQTLMEIRACVLFIGIQCAVTMDERTLMKYAWIASELSFFILIFCYPSKKPLCIIYSILYT